MKVYKIAGSTKLYQVFPVGAVYMSMVNTNPHYIFGGTWTQITDRFLYCTTNSLQTGGEATHTLNEAEMPSHRHGQQVTLDTSTGAGNIRATVVGGGSVWSGSDFNQIQNEGGGQPHNKMPPYFTVYAWYRTA